MMITSAASADLLRLLAGFAEMPDTDHPAWAETLGLSAPASFEAWQEAHTETFLTQCAPYASIYLGEQGAIGGETADRVAGFRRLLGAHIDGPPDALIALLNDYAALVAHADHDAQAAHARRALLWEHLLCWLMPYLASVARSASEPYSQWAELTRTIFYAEARHSGLPERLPLHLRVAPHAGIHAAAHGLDDVIAALLTPIRSGLILTRQDLVRIAEAFNVAVGLGSRRFIVRRLIEAQPQASLERLAEEANRQATTHADDRDALGPVADFWTQRATYTAKTLTDMAKQAHRTPQPSMAEACQ